MLKQLQNYGYKLHFTLIYLKLLAYYSQFLCKDKPKRKRQAEPTGEPNSQPKQEIMIGRITLNRTKVLGQGSPGTCVFHGTFNDGVSVKSCAVKRLLITDGEKRDKIADDMLREIQIWFELSQDQQPDIPIVRCYGHEKNEDFWYQFYQ